MGKKIDTAQSVIEYLIAVVFIIGGVSLVFADPITSVSPLLNLLGSHTAGIIYAVWFATVGIFLLAAKFRQRRKQHKHALMCVYLTTIFTFTLEFFLLGWTWYLADGVIIGLLAAAFWLRFKIQTEYLTMGEIATMRREARDLGS